MRKKKKFQKIKINKTKNSFKIKKKLKNKKKSEKSNKIKKSKISKNQKIQNLYTKEKSFILMKPKININKYKIKFIY